MKHFVQKTKLSGFRHKLYKPESGTQEAHAVLKAPIGMDVLEAWRYLEGTIQELEAQWEFGRENRLFTRIFFSDIANQLPLLRAHFPDSFSPEDSPNLAYIQQPPVPASKLALWVYWVKGNNPIVPTPDGNEYSNNGMRHLWTANLQEEGGTTEDETSQMFQSYRELLQKQGGGILNNALRTWVFVRDIDATYGSVVKARKRFFEENGLTSKTHYISSTGIEGNTIQPKQVTSMDVYSLFGVNSDQIQFLEATDYLCPTHEYGVTFERGTAISYGDRKHIFLSGTASIDKHGEVLHRNNAVKQTERILENMDALLESAQCQLSDLMHAIIYVRDASDEKKVRGVFEEALPSTPYLVLQAPVCRPAWLVEIEGMAIKPLQTEAWPTF